MTQQIPLIDAILYDSPGLGASTVELERALNEMNALPPTIARQREIAEIRAELARRAADSVA